MDYRRGIMQVFTTILGTGTVAVIAAGFFGYTLYFRTKTENILKEQKIQELLSIHQKEIASLADDISGLRSELGITKKKSAEQTTELTKKLLEEQLKRAQAEAQRITESEATKMKLTELEKGVTEAKTYDIAKIISEWRPRIAYISCDWKNNNGSVYQTQTGSGILTKEKSGYPAVVTNTHVVLDENGVPPAVCRLQFPDYQKTTTIDAVQIFKSADGLDWSRINLDSSDSHLNSLSEKSFNACADDPAVGANIVILGYPGIGSQTDITATEGIISGFDGNYYITSAKVERGNSGGAAISLKQNCYLGIPTFTRTGVIESLARILKSRLIFPQ